MSEMYLAVTVTDRLNIADFTEAYKELGVPTSFVALGSGTAKSEMLSAWGLDSTERAVCLSPVTDETWQKMRQVLRKELGIDRPGQGIVFTLPWSSVGGRREFTFLLGGQSFTKGEESVLKDTKHELLLVFCEQGHNETVMDAARACGAGGGTVLHARGTGMHRAEQFFGVTLASERDVLLIVVSSKKRNAIMKAIMEKAGPDTPAHAMCLSLPVTDTAGFRLAEDDAEEN